MIIRRQSPNLFTSDVILQRHNFTGQHVRQRHDVIFYWRPLHEANKKRKFNPQTLQEIDLHAENRTYYKVTICLNF